MKIPLINRIRPGSCTETAGESGSPAEAPGFWIHPEQLTKLPPCQMHCPNSGDIRGWLGIIAQREKMGLSLEEAFDRAWLRLVEFNPMPATVGRICPHPCETDCTRGDKDGAVSINAMERFLGDWALERELRFPPASEPGHPESIGVIGSGPAGLSFAYHMAKRGYRVTIYDRQAAPGGMLRYGIPSYRLPVATLEKEIQRILDLGVEFRLGSDVGADVSLDSLRQIHTLLFLGIGAQKARGLGVPGETGPGVYSGIEYLRARKEGERIELGSKTAIIGGGNTAIDAARMARRDGAEAVLVYRRTRAEMPAVEAEIEDALTEGVSFELLAAPTEVIREDGAVRAIEIQGMTLGEPDASGRRRPEPVEGDVRRLDVDSVIVAVSQEPDLEDAAGFPEVHGWIETREDGRIEQGLWAGGDDRGLGIASLAISHGRHAAEAAHAELRGLPSPGSGLPDVAARRQVKPDFYDSHAAATPSHRPEDRWLLEPEAEITGTLSPEEAAHEAGRCLSCGLCIGCDQCWMYCNAGGFVRLNEIQPGSYYAYLSDMCEGCGKCIEVCPTGFLSPRPEGL
jgi:formate dehydrogenase major subunit